MALNLDSIGKKIGPLTKDYTWKDVVLYALGVGAGFDELEYCYEEKLKVVPSFSIGAIFDFLMESAISSEANLGGILHGEQEIIFHNPIPKEGCMTTEGAITHMYDKGEGKGALVVAEADTWHDNGNKLFTNIFTLFCRKDGGFGGEDAPKEDIAFPDREPDFVEEYQPSVDQPLIYRLTGDRFQLHVDPEFAKASGFEMPIMHGLCTHGYTCRAVVKSLFPGEPERITLFKNRFSKTLYPGVPIKVQVWKIDDGRGMFRTVKAENDEVVIDRGVVEFMSSEDAKKLAGRKGIRYDDQVAVVTGAGAGLGRIYALDLAKRGAKVVVNDLGGAADGSGASSSAADKVVEEIKEAGGEAVANYDSVSTAEGGENIIKTAVDAFGRVDILINNAGILRDKSFAKMTPDDWDAVLAVHLDGAYNVTRPAFIKMKQQGYGRIVMTTSAAGLYGNFGQVNYSAAKMGLLGMMNTMKLEGDRYNICINTVAPVATTRLTEDILPPNMKERMQPEFISPLVLFLCSNRCGDTGGIYNTAMGYYNRAAIATGPGMVVGDGKEAASPDEILKQYKKLGEMKGAEIYPNLNAALSPMLDAFNPKATAADTGGDSGGGLTVSAIFDGMGGAFNADAAAGVEVVFQYNISGDGGGDWYVEIKDQSCSVSEGAHDSPTTTIQMVSEDFLAMMEGRLNAMSAYTSGKLKIKGDLMKSQLIEKLFKF